MTPILIVDDEPLARQVLERYVATRADLHVVGSCANAYEALDLLRRERVAILLCDIKMPEVDGFALIRSLTQPPRIILTTAHPEFALTSYDVGVVDYLMKPIALDRFMKAINRAIHPTAEPVVASPGKKPLEYLFFKVDKAFRKVFLNEIQFIEACGNYVKVHTDSEMLLVPGKISALETTLDGGEFMRVHRSYIVALAKIRQFENNQIYFERVAVPLGESYRGTFSQVGLRSVGLRSATFGRGAFPE